jgi:cytochrome bd-type quinol oxidase subunit 2
MSKPVKRIAMAAVVLLSTAWLSLPGIVSATDYISQGQTNAKQGGVSDKTVDAVVPEIIKMVMYFVGVISVIIIVISGITYATAQGDESKTKKARQALLGAIIGLAIALLAFTVTSVIESQL